MDYSKDKSGWVTYKNGKKKVKLRNYIVQLTRNMCKINSSYNFKEVRAILIDSYNKDGLSGISAACTVFIGETLKKEDII